MNLSNLYYKKVMFKRSDAHFLERILMDKNCNSISDLNLKERDINILHSINEDELTAFTFEGLKRRLKIHQETLSRVLNRLADQEILKKTNEGYTLTPKAKKLLKSQTIDSNCPTMPLLQTFLPPHVPFEKIVSNLKGKWFGALRWLGYSITNGQTVLKWITDDCGTIISAYFSQGKLHINAKVTSEADLNTALNASYQLMNCITKFISKAEPN